MWYRHSILLIVVGIIVISCSLELTPVIIESPWRFLPDSLLYEIENDITRSYISLVDYKDDKQYLYTEITRYDKQTTTYRKDISTALRITVPTLNEHDNSSYYIRIRKEQFIDYLIPLTEDNSLLLDNLEPNSYFYLDVIQEREGKQITVHSGRVFVSGQIRMINLDGYKVGNIRDLGGWKTLDGGEIVYGRLYRGAELYREKDGDVLISISEKGIKTFVNELKIDVELDFGDVSESSPLEKSGVEFIHGNQYAIQAYAKGLETETLRNRYACCIRLIIEKLSEGKNVYFHCNAGADRTGTLAFIIEALLGVSDSDLSKDYELTSFSCLNTPRYRISDGFKSLVFYFRDNFHGNNLSEQVYNMATSSIEENGLGLSQDEVALLRSILVKSY